MTLDINELLRRDLRNDITFCSNDICPLRFDCYRFMAGTDDYVSICNFAEEVVIQTEGGVSCNFFDIIRGEDYGYLDIEKVALKIKYDEEKGS